MQVSGFGFLDGNDVFYVSLIISNMKNLNFIVVLFNLLFFFFCLLLLMLFHQIKVAVHGRNSKALSHVCVKPQEYC